MSEPTPQQRAEWLALLEAESQATHTLPSDQGQPSWRRLKLIAAVRPLLAALEAAEEQAARWKIEAGVQGIARADAERHRHLLRAALEVAEAARDKLQAFKDWCHGFLDAQGVPHHPPGTHGAEGCRIGDRMDWLMDRLRTAEKERDRLAAENAKLRAACERAASAPGRDWLEMQLMLAAALTGKEW